MLLKLNKTKHKRHLESVPLIQLGEKNWFQSSFKQHS